MDAIGSVSSHRHSVPCKLYCLGKTQQGSSGKNGSTSEILTQKDMIGVDIVTAPPTKTANSQGSPLDGLHGARLSPAADNKSNTLALLTNWFVSYDRLGEIN